MVVTMLTSVVVGRVRITGGEEGGGGDVELAVALVFRLRSDEGEVCTE